MACFASPLRGEAGQLAERARRVGSRTDRAVGWITRRLGRLLPAQARRAFAARSPAAGRTRAADDSTRADRAARRPGGDADLLDRPSPGPGRAGGGAGGGRDRRAFESAISGRRGLGRRDRSPVAPALSRPAQHAKSESKPEVVDCTSQTGELVKGAEQEPPEASQSA